MSAASSSPLLDWVGMFQARSPGPRVNEHPRAKERGLAGVLLLTNTHSRRLRGGNSTNSAGDIVKIV